MKATLSLLAFVCIAQLLEAETVQVTGQSYRFSISDTVRFESKSEHEFYSFRWGQAETTQLLMLYPHPAPSSAKMVKPMVDMMEIGFEENLPPDSGLHLTSSQRIAVEFGPFKGEQLSFTLEGAEDVSVTQYIFVLHDGTRIWNGQLSGSGEDAVTRAKAILSSAEPVDD